VAVTALQLLGEATPEAAQRPDLPHVVAWNLTRRCNLACAHCYIAAGPGADGVGELTTDECLRIADEILGVNRAPMFILSGGEPLLRPDLSTLAEHAATRGATVVVGTNGTLLTDRKIEELKASGVTGVAVSVESLDATYHDRFRRSHGSLRATLDAVDRLARRRLDFVIQTTLTRGNQRELADLVDWAAERGAVAFNAYFLVASGRGAQMTGLTAAEHETLLNELVDHHVRYLGRMMVRAKCAPQFMRLVHARGIDSPILHYGTRCPCGVQYCRVTPDGKLTACPYMPEPAGDLRSQSFADVWREAPLFQAIRTNHLGGRCGRCEYRGVCGGCRARAFGVYADPLAEDPGCSYEPSGQIPVIQPQRSITYGMATERALPWTPAAEARLSRIPSFVRGVVAGRLEDYARRTGATAVTEDLMREVRSAMPLDFSRRRPFFLGGPGEPGGDDDAGA
jgi:radical SAM protein with 4Fe4S-binding SPASM domain